MSEADPTGSPAPPIAAAPTAATGLPNAMAPQRDADYHALNRLMLDSDNPRFGGAVFSATAQRDILDHIVKTFGVGDVISSLAVNGYFRAEPLVGRQITGTDNVVIVEGNRRLAACLILAGDPRAANQGALASVPRRIWAENNCPSIDPVPVITFGATEDRKELLSYLGVRHISSSAPWDSYAKAVWVSRVVENSELSVPEVAQMVGDQHRTVARLLEGYYVVRQAEDAHQFRPSDSQKSGRGSVTAYPFSWVYTILGYATTRTFLGLGDGPITPRPVPPALIPNAGILFRAMFGSKSLGLSSAVSDSRELGDLAAILASPEKVALLEQGKSIAEIVRSTRPIDERLRLGLAEIRLAQQQLIAGLSEQEIPYDVAVAHVEGARINRRGAGEIVKRLTDIISPDDDD